MDYYLFKGGSLFEELFFPRTREIWMRSFVFFIFAVQGFIAQSLVDRWHVLIKKQGEIECEKSRKNQAKSYGQTD